LVTSNDVSSTHFDYTVLGDGFKWGIRNGGKGSVVHSFEVYKYSCPENQ